VSSSHRRESESHRPAKGARTDSDGVIAPTNVSKIAQATCRLPPAAPTHQSHHYHHSARCCGW
jgi:hypothetical protein